jgi:protein required for attachment to host cells
MTTTWILVANASEAKVYANKGINKGLETVTTLNHPDSRRKGSELVSDRPGHMQGFGNGHGARNPATDPKQYEHEAFARELAQYLEQGRANNSYDRLIVVAEPHFLGLLNNTLNAQVRGLVAESVPKDYVRVTAKELASHLEKYIFL